MQPDEQIAPQIPPDPNTRPINPVQRTVIQPLSSEDDIRQAAASSGAPARSSEPGVNPASVDSSEVEMTEPTDRENTYAGSLITEPLHQSDQAPLQHNTPQAAPTPNVTTKAKMPVAKVFVVILSILGIGILGVVAWLYFFNRVPASNLVKESVNILNRESSADLAQESVAQSTYLRPKQWSQISAGASGYGNVKVEDGESTALISLSQFPESSDLNATSEEDYGRLRTFYMEEIPDNILGSAISTNAPIRCEAGTFTVTRSEDITETDTTAGLVSVVVSCKKDVGTTITMKMRIVMGKNDGRARMVVVAATELDWLKNEKIFQQMLDSVEERKTT